MEQNKVSGLSHTTGAATQRPEQKTLHLHTTTVHLGHKEQVTNAQLSALLWLGWGQISLGGWWEESHCVF